jgi:predicted RNase H-like HicB family nuclease
MAKTTFTVHITEENDGSFWAEVDELPGCFASGFSIDELKEATEEAIKMCVPEGTLSGAASWGPMEVEEVRAPRLAAVRRAKRRKTPRRTTHVYA